MLVLSRKKGQTILIPSIGLRLEVVEIKGSTVRLGVVAPRDVNVVRGELEGTSPRNAVGGGFRNPRDAGPARDADLPGRPLCRAG